MHSGEAVQSESFVAHETSEHVSRIFGDFKTCNSSFLYKKRCFVLRVKRTNAYVYAVVNTERMRGSLFFCGCEALSSSPIIFLKI